MSDPALQLTVDVPVLAEICVQLGKIEARLTQLEAGVVLTQEWYTLRQAARLKRGIELRRNQKTGDIQPFDSFFNTLKTKDHLQPNAGNPDGHQGGVPVWHRDTIQAWLQLRDEDLIKANMKTEELK